MASSLKSVVFLGNPIFWFPVMNKSNASLFFYLGQKQNFNMKLQEFCVIIIISIIPVNSESELALQERRVN